jgi:hypothetical protein
MRSAARYAAHGMIGLRCVISGNVVGMSLDDIACVRTAIDERQHIGLAVSSEFDVSLTIRDGQNRNQIRCLGATLAR